MVTLKTPKCIICGKSSEVEMTEFEYENLVNRVHVQKVFPNKSASERELIISGTHESCWNEMASDEDEED